MTALMVMGTGSDVGKSLIVAGLCRALKRRGINVAPFKPQNMSNNAAVTKCGGEIGRAQALQARAASIEPDVDMNPVLLKPESETGSQVIVQGKRVATLSARDYFKNRHRFLPNIMASFEALKKNYDIVLVEGAGSPAEVNLRKGDLANMGFASKANIPVLLVGNIHRGGVIASLVGTKLLLPEKDSRLIKAFLINNFHGDTSLFNEGLAVIKEKTGWHSAGIVPHFKDARKLPAEDAVILEKMERGSGKGLKIAVPRLPRIANFDDLDPLRLEDGVSLSFIHEGEALPGDADLVLVPGSKATMADLAFFKKQGWDIDLKAHLRRGGRVLGLCGGYQMLGEKLHDPLHIEGQIPSMEGLGHLRVETTLTKNKALQKVKAVHDTSGLSFKGYEMHLGETIGIDCKRPFAKIEGRAEGAISQNAQVEGTYLHGLFSDDVFRKAYLSSFGCQMGNYSYEQTIEETLDKLSNHLEENLDVDLLLSFAKRGALARKGGEA